jgi:ribonuclease HII
MRRAVAGLPIVPDITLIDGNRCSILTMRSQAVVNGERHMAEISAVSILAKTTRDQ